MNDETLVSKYTIKGTNEILEIHYDTNCQNPRDSDYDEGLLGTMFCYHPRYDLGDKIENKPSSESMNGIDGFKNYLIKERNAINLIPLRLYDHSGISISACNEYPYTDRWDSSFVGFIYTTKERIKELGIKNTSEQNINKELLAEVKVYNQYLTGECYGFILYKKVKCNTCNNVEDKQLDSCWGFIGYDSIEDMLKNMCEHANIKYSDLQEVK
jgi:hypothetical protein